jgi:hypothetical protein
MIPSLHHEICYEICRRRFHSRFHITPLPSGLEAYGLEGGLQLAGAARVFYQELPFLCVPPPQKNLPKGHTLALAITKSKGCAGKEVGVQ